MRRSIHICINLQGALRNWQDSSWMNCVTDDDGTTMEPWQVRDRFLQYIAEGKKVIPMDSNCDNFDYQTGCRGHEVKE